GRKETESIPETSLRERHLRRAHMHIQPVQAKPIDRRRHLCQRPVPYLSTAHRRARVLSGYFGRVHLDDERTTCKRSLRNKPPDRAVKARNTCLSKAESQRLLPKLFAALHITAHDVVNFCRN